MPLITAPVTSPPVTEPPGGGPPIRLPEIGYATVRYIDPAGTVWPLTDEPAGWFTLADGVSGLGAASYVLTADAHPRGGERLRHVQAQARAIVWPLYVYGGTHVEFIGRWRALADAFTSTLRPGPGGEPVAGVLEISRPDGSTRRINVFYREGFEGRGVRGSGIVSDVAILTLWCEDPYWVDAIPVSIHRESGAAGDFLVPYPTVSSSQVLGETVVANPGGVQVWPTWTVTGPASLITFTRQDTGAAFTLDPGETAHGPLLPGEKVVISTDPPRVRYQDGTPDGSNWIGALNWPAADLWSLPPGETPVSFQLDGAGAGSAVDLTFHPRYETA